MEVGPDWLALVFLCFLLMGALFLASNRESKELKKKYKKWKKNHSPNWKEAQLTTMGITPEKLCDSFQTAAESLGFMNFSLHGFSLGSRVLWRETEDNKVSILFDETVVIKCIWRELPVITTTENLILEMERQHNGCLHYRHAMGTVLFSCSADSNTEEGARQELEFETHRERFMKELKLTLLDIVDELSMVYANGDFVLL